MAENRFLPKQNDRWRYADGSEWIVISTKVNQERKLQVTIAAMDFSFKILEMTVDEFLDEVDTDNFPEAKQKYLYEFIFGE